MTVNSKTFIPSDLPVDPELQSGGRVLVLKCALFNPSTQKWHDIRIERSGFLGKWCRGPLNHVSQEEAERIRKTYDIILRTIDMQPGETAITGDLHATQFTQRNGSGRLEKKSSAAYEASRQDNVLLSQADAQCFGQKNMTVHDAMVSGVLAPLGLSDARTTLSEQENLPVLPLHAKEDGKMLEQIKQLPAIPKCNVEGSYFNRADQEFLTNARKAGPSLADAKYDDLTLEQRKARLTAYLDQTGPIPLSAFEKNEPPKGMSPEVFGRLRQSLSRLAVRDALGRLAVLNAKLLLATDERHEKERLDKHLAAVLEGRDAKDVYEEWKGELQKHSADRYMEKLLEHWFRASYHYLDKYSVPDITRAVLELQAEGVSQGKSATLAKENVLRELASDYLVRLNPITTLVVSDNALVESIRKTKLKPFWGWN